MKPAKNSVAAVDGLYRSVRKVIEEGRKVVSIAANAVLVRQNMFAVKYSTVMPSAEILRREIETQKELYSCAIHDGRVEDPARNNRGGKIRQPWLFSSRAFRLIANGDHVRLVSHYDLHDCRR